MKENYGKTGRTKAGPPQDMPLRHADSFERAENHQGSKTQEETLTFPPITAYNESRGSAPGGELSP